MNLDDERTNKIFTVFCYGMLIELTIGALLGALTAYFILQQ
jgi:hypothetical protein